MTASPAFATGTALDSCGYPDNTHTPRSSTITGEPEVLRAFSKVGSGASTQVIAWYSDEHALTLGVNPNVTQMGSHPTDHAANPNVGDKSAVDPAGRPIYPALFATDITANPSSRSGDWQQSANNNNGTDPDDVFGTWKSATKSGSSITPAGDPATNNSFGPGADTPPSGITWDTYRSEIRWNIGSFGSPGHTYRVQVMIHDGDLLRTGGDVGEACTTFTIPKAQPAITTQATSFATAGQPIGDSAHLSGGFSPTGTVAFRVYASDTCPGSGTLISTNAVDANGNAASGPYSPTTAGHYYWRAFYSGDASNDPVSGPCKAANEDTVVAAPHLAILKQVSKDAGASYAKSVTTTAGDSVRYRFTVTNDGSAGTDLTAVHVNELSAIADCDSSLHATSPSGFAGNLAVGQSVTFECDHVMGTADLVNTAKAQGTFTPPSGGGGPQTILSGPDSATVHVVKHKPAVTTQVGSARIGTGHNVTDTATFTGGYLLTGQTATFEVFGPNDPSCAGPSIALGPGTIDAAGHATSGAFTPSAPGTYLFKAHYAGDANNEPAGGGCGDANETVEAVSPAVVAVTKDADSPTAFDGDKITFTISARNTGGDALKNVVLHDAIKGTTHTCESVSGPTGDNGNGQLDPGETWKYVCTVTVVHSEENANHEIVNVAHIEGDTVTSGDHVVSNDDDAFTRILHPRIAIEKTGPATGQAGDRISYVLTVTNPGDEGFPEAGVAVADRQCNGDPVTLLGKGGDASPGTLDPGDAWSYSCSVQTAVGDTTVHNVAAVDATDTFGKHATAQGTADTTLTQPAQLVLPVRITPGAARLTGPTGCTAKAFNARVRGTRIATVTFVLDGKVVKRFKKPLASGNYAVRVNPAKMRIGVHRLVVNVTFQPGTATKPKTMRLSFQRCGKKLVTPRFTG